MFAQSIHKGVFGVQTGSGAVDSSKMSSLIPLRLLIFILALGTCAGTPPRLALVLSGGGARGLAQIGVLKALDDEGIRPDLIVATSMGAIVGGLYACGLSPDSIAIITKSVDWDDVTANSARRRNIFVSQKNEPSDHLFELRFSTDLTPIIPHSISHGQAIYDIVAPLVVGPLHQAGMHFDSLHVPLRIVATDIVSGKQVVFSKGDLARAIRASCGVPVAFSPVEHDSMLLLDGGLTANIPASVAADEGAEYIVAVDVTSPMWERGELKNPVRLVDQVVAIGVGRRKGEQIRLASLVIRPELSGIRNTRFEAFDTLIARGYTAGKQKANEIREGLAGLGNRSETDRGRSAEPLPRPYRFRVKGAAPPGILDTIIGTLRDESIPRDAILCHIDSVLLSCDLPFAKTDISTTNASGTTITVAPGAVGEILIDGARRTSLRLIKTASGLKTGDILTGTSVRDAIASLHGTGLFHNVNIVVLPNNTVRIAVKEKEYYRVRFGLRMDEYDLVEGYLQPGHDNLFGLGIRAIFHLQYGEKREKYAFELSSNRLFTTNWANRAALLAYRSRETVGSEEERPTYDPEDSSLTGSITRSEWITLQKTGLQLLAGTQLWRVTMFDILVQIEKFMVNHSENLGVVEDPWGRTFRKGIRSVALRLTVDDLDRFPFPMNGHRHYINLTGASDIVGGTESFVSVHGSLCYHRTIRGRHTLSPSAIFAWAGQPLPDAAKVYLGGFPLEQKYRDIGVYNYVSFTGLRPRSVAGDIVFLFRGAYRFAVTKRFFVTAAVDWGKTWDEPDFEFDTKTAECFARHGCVGIGVGLAVQTLLGPIRMSWGRVVAGTLETDYGIGKENVLYFSAGYDF